MDSAGVNQRTHKNIQACSYGGFTLIEVLVAFAVFSIIIASLYSSLFVSWRAMDRGSTNLLKLHELRTFMDLIRRETESALTPSGDKYQFKIKDRDIYGKQASELSFTTFLSYKAGALTAQYYIEETKEGLVLMKKALPAYEQDKEAMPAEMIEGISSFTVEAFDGSIWTKTWTGEALPDIVRITITMPYMDKLFTMTETISPKVGRRA